MRRRRAGARCRHRLHQGGLRGVSSRPPRRICHARSRLCCYRRKFCQHSTGATLLPIVLAHRRIESRACRISDRETMPYVHVLLSVAAARSSRTSEWTGATHPTRLQRRAIPLQLEWQPLGYFAPARRQRFSRIAPRPCNQWTAPGPDHRTGR